MFLAEKMLITSMKLDKDILTHTNKPTIKLFGDQCIGGPKGHTNNAKTLLSKEVRKINLRINLVFSPLGSSLQVCLVQTTSFQDTSDVIFAPINIYCGLGI